MRLTEEILGYFDNLCHREKSLVWIATTSNGIPHVVPICYVKSIGDDQLLVAHVFIDKTVKNIEEGSKVALGTAKRTNGYDGYMIKGRAEVIKQGPLFESMKRAVEDATKGRRRPKSVILVNAEEVYSLKPRTERKRIF